MKKLSEIEITEELIEKVSKCTTAEELNSLAHEYDVELTAEEISDILESNKLKELNDDDLDQVTGGSTQAETNAKYLPANHGKFIDNYEAKNYIGQKVYVVMKCDPQVYFWGPLVKSGEIQVFGKTLRTHSVVSEGRNNYDRAQLLFEPGETAVYTFDGWSLYLMY